MDDDIRFIADVMLGKLAKWMRILGWDVSYDNTISDSQLLRDAEREGRIVLTRDRRMIEEWKVDRYLLMRSDDPTDQLREVVRRFGRPMEGRLLERCLVCNVVLDSTDQEMVKGSVPEYISKVHTRFSSCSHCGRIYWRGSHYNRMKEKLAIVLKDIGTGDSGELSALKKR